MEDRQQVVSLGTEVQISFWKLQFAGWLLYGAAIYITFLTVTTNTASMLRLAEIKGVRTAIGFCLTSLMRYPFRRFLVGKSIGAAALAAVFCAIPMGLSWGLLEQAYLFFVRGGSANWAQFPKVALDYAMTSFAWSAAYLGGHYAIAWKQERERALESQLEAVRYQLNPHFLFNALNSIRAMIDEDAGRARTMITEFSGFLRYSLAHTAEVTAPLEREVEAVECLLAIEKIRFEDKLQVEFAIDPASRTAQVPVFALHTLVENALKHGRDTSPPPLRLRIASERKGRQLTLRVENTGSLSSKAEGTGRGLAMLEARLPKNYSFDLAENNGWVRAILTVDCGAA